MDTTLSHLGLVKHMPPDTYFAVQALSKSGMDHLDRSPLHYFKRVIERDANAPAPPAPSPQMFNGTLTHCLVLEPLEWDKRYVIGPEEARNTKTWKQFIGEYQGKVGVKPSEHALALAQANSVRSKPLIAQTLASGECELSVFWKESIEIEPGLVVEVLCKARPDFVHPVGTRDEPGAVLLDLKTTSDASPDGFSRLAFNYRYYRQAAWYSRGFTRATGIPVRGFVLAVVESEYPFVTSCYVLDDQALALGERECLRNVQLLARCQHRNDWPGYTSEDVAPLALPPWAYKEQP